MNSCAWAWLVDYDEGELALSCSLDVADDGQQDEKSIKIILNKYPTTKEK